MCETPMSQRAFCKRRGEAREQLHRFRALHGRAISTALPPECDTDPALDCDRSTLGKPSHAVRQINRSEVKMYPQRCPGTRDGDGAYSRRRHISEASPTSTNHAQRYAGRTGGRPELDRHIWEPNLPRRFSKLHGS